MRNSFIGAMALVLVTLWPVGVHPNAEQTDWRRVGLVSVARSELGAVVIDSSIYLVGGFGAGERIDRYDTETGLWTNLHNLPEAIHHPGIAVLDGNIYVAGGYAIDGSMASGAVWRYRVSGNAWERVADLPAPRGALGMAAVNGRLYAIGGATEHLSGPVTGEVDAYDPNTDRWEAKTSMIAPREHLAVVAADGKIYAIGGRANGDESDEFAAANERYDPPSNTWQTMAPLPDPRGGLSGVFANGNIIVIGGERGPKAFDAVTLYDPRTDRWRSLPPMPTPRHGLACAWVNGTLYAMSGSTRAQVIENTPIFETLSVSLR